MKCWYPQGTLGCLKQSRICHMGVALDLIRGLNRTSAMVQLCVCLCDMLVPCMCTLRSKHCLLSSSTYTCVSRDEIEGVLGTGNLQQFVINIKPVVIISLLFRPIFKKAYTTLTFTAVFIFNHRHPPPSPPPPL